MQSARQLLGRLCRCEPLVVAVAVVTGVAVYYASVPLNGFLLLDLTGVSLSMDRPEGFLLFAASLLLSAIFATLTALWITHMARTQASGNGEDQGRCKPSLVAVAVLAGGVVFSASYVLMDRGFAGVISRDGALDLIVNVGVRQLLPVVFAMLTALWITHMARTQASRNREDEDEGSPPP